MRWYDLYAVVLVIALCGMVHTCVASGDESDSASFAAVSSHAHIGSGRFHLAEHEAIASRIHRANAEAAAETEVESEAEIGSTAALDRFLQDPNVAEADKLVARLEHASSDGSGHFFADRFHLESIRRAHSEPRMAEAMDELSLGAGEEEDSEIDSDASELDVARFVEVATADSEEVNAEEAAAEDESESKFAALMRFRSLMPTEHALEHSHSHSHSHPHAPAKPVPVSRRRQRNHRPNAVPSSVKSAKEKKSDAATSEERPKKPSHSDIAHSARVKRRRNRAARKQLRKGRKHRARVIDSVPPVHLSGKFTAHSEFIPTPAEFKALLIRKRTVSGALPPPDMEMCGLESILRALDAYHVQSRPAVRDTLKTGFGRQPGMTATLAITSTATAPLNVQAGALEDAQLNEIIDSVEDWLVTRLPLISLHIPQRSKRAGCRNLRVQPIVALKVLALNRLGEAQRKPVGSPAGFEEIICSLRGANLWKWLDGHMSAPNGEGDRFLTALEGKLRFGEDHTRENADPSGLTLIYLTLRQLGAEYRGQFVIRLLTLPTVTYANVNPLRLATVRAEAERVLSVMFTNTRVATRFLLHKVYFAILPAEKKLTQLVPNLEGVKVGNLRSRTWASVRGVGGATGYLQNGRLIVPPLQYGWKEVTIPSVAEQTLKHAPPTTTADGSLPEGWMKVPVEDGLAGQFEYYHEFYPPLVEFVHSGLGPDGAQLKGQKLEGYERPVQCEAITGCTPIQMAIFPEENLLNNEALVPPTVLDEVEHGYAQGYSIATHEMAHCLDMNGLHSTQHNVLSREYTRKMAQNLIFTDGWRDPKRRITRGCYASHTVYEYFAQLTNTWLGTNHGLDPHFSMCVGSNPQCRAVAPNDIAACAAVSASLLPKPATTAATAGGADASVSVCDSEHFPRANTQAWVTAHESPLVVTLLYSLYARARLVSYPVTLNAGFGYIATPDSSAGGFKGVYFVVNKSSKQLTAYKQPTDVGRTGPTAPTDALVLPLTGAGNAIWEEHAGPASLWKRRPTPVECVVLTTVHKKKFYVCQRDIEQLLTALNEAIFLS